MRRIALLAVALCACNSGPGSQTPPDGGVLADGGHALPGPGFAAVWQVKDVKELVSGPSTGGRVGDWQLANSHVRFIVEDARPSDGYDPYGCSIAAADRQRDAGIPGESRWGEVWLGLNFRAAACDTISIVNDGSDGEPAVLRAVGHDAESPFMASLFAVGSTPPPLHATIYREYSLAPDTDALELNLTIQNDGQEPLDITAPYVGMAMNRGLRHWVNKSGFDFDFSDLARVNTSAEFYAAVGDHISYSLFELHAPFSPILNFAHVLIGQYPQIHIAAGQSDTFRLAVAVGTGDVGSLQVAHAELVANPDPLLSGTVTDASGSPVAGARVHVTDSSGAQAISFARSGADGRWTTRVPTGGYLVRAVANDRPGSAPQTVVVPSSGLTGVTLALGAQSSISASVTDAQGHPIPAKIVLEPDVSTPRPTLAASLGEMWGRQPIIVFSADGTASVPVYPGSWQVTFSHGFEYDLPSATVSAPAGGSATASRVLHHVVDTTGWLSGDFHIHAQYSPDGEDLLSLKVRAFAADGVEIPVSTEHEFVGDFGPAATALALTPFMHTIAGTELTTTAVGHFNVFPLTPQPAALNAGGFSWYNRTIPDVMAEARTRLTADGDPPVLQMNHPRTPGMAYLDAVHFDPASFSAQIDAADFMSNWDAMEVWNGVYLPSFEGCPVPSDPAYSACLFVKPSHPTGYDWFSFLDRAKFAGGAWSGRITGTGNSDSHRAETQTVGYPRNYVQTGVDDPSAVTDKQVTAALRAMKVTISGGPFLTIGATASGAPGTPDTGPGGIVKPDFATGTVHLAIKVQAPPWMGKLQRLDLWMGDSSANGGAVVKSIDLSADPGNTVVRLNTTVEVPAGASDNWVIATVRGVTDSQGHSSALWPVVQVAVPPYAITNPIWIDANGDGAITPLR